MNLIHFYGLATVTAIGILAILKVIKPMGLFSQSISPPTNTSPATLLRWASSFRGLTWMELLPIARAQAAIADWPSATFTLVKMQEAPLPLFGTEEGRDHAIEAARWMLDQIRQGLDPPEPPDYAHRDLGPRPKPFPVSGAGDGILQEGSSDKAAFEGRFEEALSLARNYVPGPDETLRDAAPYCVIAKYQIIHEDIEGARQTLDEAFEVALNAPKSNFAVGRPRDENLCAVAALLADTGDFQRAEQILEMAKTKGAGAYGLAVCYARNNDPSNAVRMLVRIREDDSRAKACVDVVRILIDELRGQTKWPYSSLIIIETFERSHDKLGDVLTAQGNLTGALASYRASLAIRERYAQADPQNAGWQRDLAWSHWRLAANGDQPRLHWQRVVDILRGLDADGRLSPVDRKWLPIAERNLAAAE